MVQIFELLTKRTFTKLLLFFLDNPSGEFYETEIRKKLRISKGSSVKWIGVLSSEGLVQKSTKGRINLYKLNSEDTRVIEIKKLKIISELHPILEGIKDSKIFLYGSSARGEYREESDVDILVIGSQNRSITDVFRKAENVLKRRIKPSFYTELEWSRMQREDPAFYERVEKDKVRLL